MAWYDDALCVGASVDFFAEDSASVAEAKNICFECPVRQQCLQYALNSQERFGVWGGADEKEIRRALGVDQFGKPVRRGRSVKCPYCKSTDVVETEKNRTKIHQTCNNCHIKWWTRRVSKVVEIDADEEMEGFVRPGDEEPAWN